MRLSILDELRSTQNLLILSTLGSKKKLLLFLIVQMGGKVEQKSKFRQANHIVLSESWKKMTNNGT